MKTQRSIIVTVLMALVVLAAGASAQDPQPVLPEAHIAAPWHVIYQQESAYLISSPTFQVAFEYDHEDVAPGYLRYLLKPALLPGGQYINTRYLFDLYGEAMLADDDPGWSAWEGWNHDPYHTFSLTDLDQEDSEGRRIHYLLAIQVMSEDGVVSLARRYGRDVANFAVTTNLTPTLRVFHPLLGERVVNGDDNLETIELLPGLDFGFTFEANAENYGGVLESYRWGWDLADPDDPDDPNWAVPPGLGDEQRQAPPIPFTSGVHTLTVQVLDTTGNLTRLVLVIDMVPIPDPSSQFPLLLVDDVNDRSSNAWPAEDGTPLDRDEHRDAFWTSVVSGAGGVAGFDPIQHAIDTADEMVELRDIVQYRSVIWTGRWASGPASQIAQEFRAQGNEYTPVQARYVWLAAYQEHAGNLLYASNRAAMNFLPESPYIMPIVFESAEGSYYSGYDYIPPAGAVRVGFGNNELGPVYPLLYPYRDLGLAAVDATSPGSALYTPNGQGVSQARARACVGLKGLVLDEDFVASHMGGSAAFADTIWTEPTIDWTDDPMPADHDPLQQVFVWGQDEFYDADIIDRGTPFTPQDCDGEACVEPLWRMSSRFDWVRQQRRAVDPDDTWPEGYYDGPDQPSLVVLCGQEALDDARLSARTDGQVTGFVSRKHLENKPSGVGDVVLGFDPYRFDHASMRSAIRWVLGEHFGLSMNP